MHRVLKKSEDALRCCGGLSFFGGGSVLVADVRRGAPDLGLPLLPQGLVHSAERSGEQDRQPDEDEPLVVRAAYLKIALELESSSSSISASYHLPRDMAR